MKVCKKTQGLCVQYEINNNIISFQHGELVIDFGALQCGYERTVDISFDDNGKLMVGVGVWYVAQIVIPPCKFIIRENGITDAMGFRQITKTKIPLNTDDVTLILWTLEEK